MRATLDGIYERTARRCFVSKALVKETLLREAYGDGRIDPWIRHLVCAAFYDELRAAPLEGRIALEAHDHQRDQA